MAYMEVVLDNPIDGGTQWTMAKFEEYLKMNYAYTRINPTCLIHGMKWSEHTSGRCLYCCRCFKPMEVEDCAINSDGEKEDVCRPCAKHEKAMMLKKKWNDSVRRCHTRGYAINVVDTSDMITEILELLSEE